MPDRQTLRLAIQYAALFLGSVTVLSLGILLYMNSAGGGDYLKDIGVAGGPGPRVEQAQKTADAVQDRLEQGLMLINALLILIIPVVSYRMARAAIKPIQDGLEAQQQFADNASHELGTPLSVIKGELQLAISKRRPVKDYEAAIKASLAEVDNLARLTQSLTLLARGEAGEVQAGFEPVDLDAVVRACLKAVEPVARGVRIQYEGHREAKVTGDPSLLRTLVFNLVDNAMKYSDEGGQVEVELARDGPDWAVTVRDFGPGIPEPELALATRRFWRSGSARAMPGRGLGLAIAGQIARLHHGQISLANGEAAGLVAQVRLPSANV